MGQTLLGRQEAGLACGREILKPIGKKREGIIDQRSDPFKTGKPLI